MTLALPAPSTDRSTDQSAQPMSELAIKLPFRGDPWTRQEHWKETAKNFLAFTCYRDLPIESRSYARAEEEYRIATGKVCEPGSIKHASGRFCEWAAKFRWKERAEKFDDWKDEQDLIALQKTRIKTATRQATNAARTQNILMEPVVRLEKRLAKLVEEDDLDKLSTEDLIRLVKETAKIGIELQKAERAAVEAVGVENKKKDGERRTVKGEILRRVFETRKMEGVGFLEHVAFAIEDSRNGSDSTEGDGSEVD